MTFLNPTEFFSKFEISEGEKTYLKGQAERLIYVANLVQRYSDCLNQPADLLDVGPHFLTRYLLEAVTPKPNTSVLGYPYSKLTPTNMLKKIKTIDLNDCAAADDLFEGSRFDIITFCEVVEHLFIPPDVILRFLRRFLKPSGVLILGTPNAACLYNRIQMMLGVNPFHELTAEWRKGAGHIREYTMAELTSYGEKAGLEIDFREYCSYWKQAIYIPNLERFEAADPSLKVGITIVFRNTI